MYAGRTTLRRAVFYLTAAMSEFALQRASLVSTLRIILLISTPLSRNRVRVALGVPRLAHNLTCWSPLRPWPQEFY